MRKPSPSLFCWVSHAVRTLLLSLFVLRSSGCPDSNDQTSAPNDYAVSGEMIAAKIIDGFN